jgi:hypothetical protein
VPDFHPGAKVRLNVRLEDNSRGIYPPTPAPAEDGTGPESFGSGSPDGLPFGDFLSITVDVVPTSCTVELNSYRTADTAKLEIPLARLPIDPRLVRAISVQIFGGVFAPEEFSEAMAPGADLLVMQDLPDDRTAVPDSFGGMTNELFRGFADKIVVDVAENTIELDCRDLTGELLDAEIPPNMLQDLPGYLRLDEAIQLLLTGDQLAGVDIDQRIAAEQTKEIGRKRRKLRAEFDLSVQREVDAQIQGGPNAPAVVAEEVARQLAIEAEIQALRGSVEALPPVSTRFGMPGFRGTKVVNEVIDITDPTGTKIQDLPTLDKIRPKAWVDSRGTTRKGRKKSTGNKNKVSFWDFIADLVTSAGYICFLRPPRESKQLVAVELVISNPRTYYRESVSAGDELPLAIDTREFAWGQNVEGLTLERNLKGTAVPSVGVRAYDAATGERYGRIYPPVQKNNRPSTTGKGDRLEIKQFNLDQITGDSPDDIIAQLEAAARSIYEQLSRGDMQIGLKTHHLSALPRNVQDGIVGDIFAMRPKDPFALELPADDPVTGIVSAGLILDETDIAKRIEQGRLAGLSPDDARTLAEVSISQYLQREFRTTKVTLTFSTGDGWEVQVGGINFLDIRDSVNATSAAT